MFLTCGLEGVLIDDDWPSEMTVGQTCIIRVVFSVNCVLDNVSARVTNVKLEYKVDDDEQVKSCNCIAHTRGRWRMRWNCIVPDSGVSTRVRARVIDEINGVHNTSGEWRTIRVISSVAEEGKAKKDMGVGKGDKSNM